MTITAITEKTISTETELGELLVKILHRLDRQTQKVEFLQAENAELRQRVEKLERERTNYTTAETAMQEAILLKRDNSGQLQAVSGIHGAKYEVTSPAHSSTARKS